MLTVFFSQCPVFTGPKRWVDQRGLTSREFSEFHTRRRLQNSARNNVSGIPHLCRSRHNAMKFFFFLIGLPSRVFRRLRVLIDRRRFRSFGKGSTFDPDGWYSYENITIGEDVHLGLRPILMAAKSEIVIGKKVMFGPQVVLIGGGHNTSEVGRFMVDVHEKRPEDDRGVIIEDDVWIGCRAMILRGVRIGRGSIIAAGSVVTKSVPPYSIMAGTPARPLKRRWDVETILRHEEALYPASERLSREDLERWEGEWNESPRALK